MNPYEFEQTEKEVDDILRKSNTRGSIFFGLFLLGITIGFISVLYLINQVNVTVLSYLGLNK